LFAAVVSPRGNHLRFQEFCAKSKKWFRRAENGFVAAVRTKQFQRKFNDINGLTIQPVKRLE
jgi:hypothetical protein